MDHLYLYTRPGCDLCDEARSILEGLLAERTAAGLPSPTVVERDIDSNDWWQRAFLATIPVMDLGERRLELAVGPIRIRQLLADALDTPAPAAPDR
jgi:hypothetical protein